MGTRAPLGAATSAPRMTTDCPPEYTTMIGYPTGRAAPDGRGLGDSFPLHDVGMFVWLCAGERTKSIGRRPKLYAMSPTTLPRPPIVEKPQPIVEALGCIRP